MSIQSEMSAKSKMMVSWMTRSARRPSAKRPLLVVDEGGDSFGDITTDDIMVLDLDGDR